MVALLLTENERPTRDKGTREVGLLLGLLAFLVLAALFLHRSILIANSYELQRMEEEKASTSSWALTKVGAPELVIFGLFGALVVCLPSTAYLP